MERAFWLLDRGARFNGVGLVVLRGPIDEHLLQAGLKRLQAQHPLLRVRVAGDDRSLRFTEQGAGAIPLRVVHSASGCQHVVEHELNLPFAADTDHLSRVTWVRDTTDPERSELVVTIHHVIADALSIVFAVRDLLSAIFALSCTSTHAVPVTLLPPLVPALPEVKPLPEVKALPQVKPLPPVPPLPELLPQTVRGLARFRSMQAYFEKQVLNKSVRRARKLPLQQPAPPEKRRNCLVQRTLTPAQTRALGEQARAAGASIHGALCAALLLGTAAAAYAAELAADTPTTIGCFTALNLREQLSPKVDADLGLYISQVTTFHQVVPLPPLWQLAREVKAQLAETLESGEQFLTMPLIGLFIPWGKNPGPRFIRRFDGGSPAAIGVSNLARPPIPSVYGALRIENLSLAAGVSVVGQLMAIVTTWEDQLNLNLVFSEPLVSRARAEQIADAAIQHLRAGAGLADAQASSLEGRATGGPAAGFRVS